ncbi:MAG: GNAT family N-acetyltransferase [Bacteroidota bacterium]
MTNPSLRTWTVDDIETVRNIAWVTWKETYGPFIPEKDLRAYLDDQYSRTKLEEKVRNHLLRGVIASWDNVDVAYMIVASVPQEGRCYVSSVYVLPAYQGKGIGSSLLSLAREIARGEGYNSIWLAVMTENRAAREWYERMGFQFPQEAPFTMGSTTVNHLIGFQRFDEHTSHDRVHSV